jgi:hypothetical protein
MVFILSAERRGTPGEVSESFSRYREYLRSSEDRFPVGAFQLATASWYFDFSDHRSPHDGRLRELRVSEETADETTGRQTVGLVIRLTKPYDGTELEFAYPGVVRYTLHLGNGGWGHRDWRYDEFRLSEDGHVVHEIEWSGPSETGRWEIVASDVLFRVIPSEGEG